MCLEYESPIYSSPRLGKMRVFGPFKTDIKKRDFQIIKNFWLHGVQFCERESFHRVNVKVSKLMISTVDREFASTCMGKENEALVFVFDVCHEDLMTK